MICPSYSKKLLGLNKEVHFFQLQHDGRGGRFVQQVLAQRGSELSLESPGRRPLDLRVQGPGQPQQPTEAGHFKRLPAG